MKNESAGYQLKLSVIIPVYQDIQELASFMNWWKKVPRKEDMELIICAAESDEFRDALLDLADGAVARTISKPSRALQMNKGAEAARGEYLFFIHVDSRPPKNFYDIIMESLSTHGRVAGAFSHRFAESENFASLALVSFINRVRYSLTRIYYGDQGLFLREKDFQKIGGFENLSLMEDVAMIKKLKKVGEVALARQIMQTSGKRFLKNGVWRTFFWMWRLLCRDCLGLDIQRYGKLYRDKG